MRQIEDEVLGVLGISAESRGLIKSSLLKVLQENWQSVFAFAKTNWCFTDSSETVPVDALEEVNEALLGEDCAEFIE